MYIVLHSILYYTILCYNYAMMCYTLFYQESPRPSPRPGSRRSAYIS